MRKCSSSPRGGFSSEEIIQCASLNAAKMIGIDDKYGSIEKGKFADMVLLNEDPRTDIAHTLSIEAVIKGGELQERL